MVNLTFESNVYGPFMIYLYPYIQYSSAGNSVTYTCGIYDYDQICCCALGNTDIYCTWDTSTVYTECVKPPLLQL